jgi:hypothetical protein
MYLSELEVKILLDCNDDYVSVWNIMRKQNLQLSTDEPIPESIIRNGFAAIYNLLKMDLIIAGHFEGGKFTVSSLSADEVIKRLADEKMKFESTPLFYVFIYWFDLTKLGKDIVQEIDAIK